MFERPKTDSEPAILVHLNIGNHESELEEFKELVRAAGAECKGIVLGSRSKPDPKFYAGSGKVEEIKSLVKATEAEIVIFDHELSPSQERNLEKEFSCRVISRTGLILDIFAQRARTHEGKLQVELAQLQHMSTRLIRGFSEDYDSQKGGIGLRGPGETQLESDRRLLKLKILAIEEKLEKVAKQRSTLRRGREKSSVPTVALVGYTNAGKSSLFNALTGSDVMVADMLFATLDPTVRMISLPIIDKVMLADTVGFVRDLPHKLVAAFSATLEETTQADILLHVIDLSSPHHEDTIAQVNAVLAEIGADKVPQIKIYNKIDVVGEAPLLVKDENGQVTTIFISALKGLGLDLLQDALVNNLSQKICQGVLRLEPKQGKIHAYLYEIGAIKSESYSDVGDTLCQIQMPIMRWHQLCETYQNLEEQFTPEGE